MADGLGRAGRGWTRGEVIIVAAGVLLLLDLVFLDWQQIVVDPDLEQFGVELPTFRLDRRGLQDPHAFFGIASAVVTALMVVQVVTAKISAAIPRGEQLHLIAGAVVLGLVVAKLIATRDFLGIGAWLGAALAAGVAYGGFLLSQETTAGTGRTVSRP